MQTKTNVRFGFIVLLVSSIWLTNLGGWDLWNPDEPRYAQASREMMENGSYVLPQVNGRPYSDKPPLFFWLIILVSQPFGDVTAYSARLPSALAGLGLMLLTYLFGKKLYDRQTGFLAAVILCTSKEIFTTAISVHFDVILAFLITLSLYLFYCGYKEPKKKFFLTASYVCMGLAVLTKGPVGMVVPLLVIIVFLLANREGRGVSSIHLGKGICIIVGMVLVWLVPACILGGESYSNDILLQQTFGRIINSYSHKKPFYYYLYNFPLDFFPWSLFIPAAGVYFVKNREQYRLLRFPLAWFAGVFVFFTLMSCKRTLYLIPLYPAAALLTARFWTGYARMEDKGSVPLQAKTFRVSLYVLFGLFVAAGFAGTAAFVRDFSIIRPFQSIRWSVYPALSLSMLCGITGCIFVVMKKKARWSFTTIAVTMIVLSALIVFDVYPAFNRFKSARPFCRRIQKVVGRHDTLVATFEPKLFNYFLNRYPINRIEAATSLEPLLRSGEKIYILMKERHYKKASGDIKDLINIVDRGAIGHKTYFLITRKARENIRQQSIPTKRSVKARATKGPSVIPEIREKYTLTKNKLFPRLCKML